MSSKKSAAKGKSSKAAASGSLPPYGVPINEAIASGNVREMKAMVAQTRKYIAELERALKVLDGEIAKRNG